MVLEDFLPVLAAAPTLDEGPALATLLLSSLPCHWLDLNAANFFLILLNIFIVFYSFVQDGRMFNCCSL